jgi:dTDP-4-amino-4,6-dideoxygalactose transaminase
MPAALALDGGTPVRTKPFHPWPVHDEREIEALRAVIESGNWGGFPSPNVHAARFAERFAQFQTARFGICTSSGTTALEVALKAAGVRAGDEVIIPALTFVATAAAALYMGAVPVFVDVDPGTWCIDPEQAEAAVSERTKAILPVHLGSRMADMDAIMDLARRHGLRVIEDCAHMQGGAWRTSDSNEARTGPLRLRSGHASGSSPPSPSTPLPAAGGAGSIGDLGCFSFQQSKLMTAGEGGIIITNDEELARTCHAYVDCGRLRPGDKPPSSQGLFGWNYRMTEFQAAVLEVQLQRLPEQQRVREANKAYLTERLQQIDGVETLRDDERMTTKSGYGFYFRYRAERCGGVPRDKFFFALRAEGIPASGAFYEPVYRDRLFAWRDTNVSVDYSAVSCPVAERAAYEESIWLPHHIFLGPREDVDDVVRAIEKVTAAFR